MNYIQITPNRPEPMAPLPATDTLFQFENGMIVRMRVTAKTTEGAVRTQAPEPGDNEHINMKLQCSLCKDDSGDVRLDQAKNHMLLAAEVHGISAEALLNDKVSFEAWLAERVDEVLRKAGQKAYVLDRVLAKYHVPAAEDPKPRVTWEMHEALLQRVAALEEARRLEAAGTTMDESSRS